MVAQTDYDGGARVSFASVPKRLLDITMAATGLLMLAPLLFTVGMLLLAAQGGPVLIKHRRVGQGGKLFPCLKFRTMVVNAGAVLEAHLEANPEARVEWLETRKLKDDPRITWLGRALRSSSVDELPQLLNILRGEMSLVGPRPIVQEEVPYYGTSITLYERVKPGLTGPWQIGGRSDVSYDQRVLMDCDYVRGWTLMRDVYIILKTVPAVLASKGSY